MIDAKYGLKYSFPHTLVHIVDNSMYTGETPVTVTYDPSLFATIVVTGMPMGVDNKVVTITRSDVLNKAFGADTLTTADIEKYGQAVEYPSSLLNQNAPVKLIRVTPDDAQYGVVVIYIEWRPSLKNDGSIEVRLRQATIDELSAVAIDLSAYSNPERLAKATFTKLASNTASSPDRTIWRREVLMTYVSAGRGSAYNNYAIYINKASYDQARKYKNAVYNFGTIEASSSTALTSEVEAFTASMINDTTKLSAYGVTSTIDTVNVQMKKRLEGSSIMIPYVNEQVIRVLYNEWHEKLREILENDQVADKQLREVYKYIYNNLDVNQFDCIFGKTYYNDVEINIPYLIIDAIDSDIPKADDDKLVVAYESYGSDTTYTFTKLNDVPTGVTWEETNTDEPWKNYYTYSGEESTLPTESTTVADFTKITEFHEFTDYTNGVYEVTEETTPHTEFSEELSEPKAIEAIYKKKLQSYMESVYDIGNSARPAINTISNGYQSTSIVPGTMYLTNSSTLPTIQIISSINGYTGSVNVISIPKLKTLNTDGTFRALYDIDDTVDPPTRTFMGYDTATIKKYFEYRGSSKNPDDATLLTDVNKQLASANKQILTATTANKAGSIVAVGYTKSNGIKTFKLYQVGTLENGDVKIATWINYPENYYAALDYTSHYTGTEVDNLVGLYSNFKNATDDTAISNTKCTSLTIEDSVDYTEASDARSKIVFGKIGALIINDLDMNAHYLDTDVATGDENNPNSVYEITQVILNAYETVSSTPDENGNYTTTYHFITMPAFTENNFRVGNPPKAISISQDMIGTFYDVEHTGDTAYEEAISDAAWFKEHASDDSYIWRYVITGTALSAFKLANSNTAVPANYYSEEYGISTISENGGLPVSGGSSGFFDDESISSIEFKLKYSELLVKAFKGEIDPRILSPVRVPAKFMFDAGYNTVLGIQHLPYVDPSVEDIIYASTVFTDEEKEEFAYDTSIIKGRVQFADVDVKQAMYDLMIQRCYQGIPEDKRPIGPGSGLQLHLDSCYCDIEAIKRINDSFKTRFTNPNASWDIGGYTSALNGMTYTYVKRIVDNLFAHCQLYTVNKPFVNTYATIPSEEFTDFFPNIDATDWDLEQLMYTSGGNSWILDIEGNLRRKSQRTLYREETGTSDLLQENNMRTLSQLIYLLQNQLDNWLLEYVDDGIVTSMTESINNIFANWVGTRVQALDIQFEKDTNTDGGDIVVCYVNVTFRGLLLRVPIIVNVNRRTS